ncbi:hypothetical protein ACRQ5D_32535 [Mucilaginibacter sp. P25]|uniref:Lipoprotein n=1 Tax=Mucilaginibacter gossypii TaxID=551996 RepID=A0A1G8BM34_9SPHI|nr:hypothetical protein [Mucilaginibacter gossypii]SDH34236.1 hypothetical protein SAMN05192573_1098 [Mucilaginibacter gossypii]
MNKTSFAVLISLLTFCLLSCGCSRKDEQRPFRAADSVLTKYHISDRNSGTFYLIADASCEFCVKNLEFFLRKVPRTDRHILYTTGFSKIRYADLPIRSIVDSSNLVILPGYALLENAANYTHDIKGPYKIEISDHRVNEITSLKLMVHK